MSNHIISKSEERTLTAHSALNCERAEIPYQNDARHSWISPFERAAAIVSDLYTARRHLNSSNT